MNAGNFPPSTLHVFGGPVPPGALGSNMLMRMDQGLIASFGWTRLGAASCRLSRRRRTTTISSVECHSGGQSSHAVVCS